MDLYVGEVEEVHGGRVSRWGLVFGIGLWMRKTFVDAV